MVSGGAVCLAVCVPGHFPAAGHFYAHLCKYGFLLYDVHGDPALRAHLWPAGGISIALRAAFGVGDRSLRYVLLQRLRLYSEQHPAFFGILSDAGGRKDRLSVEAFYQVGMFHFRIGAGGDRVVVYTQRHSLRRRLFGTAGEGEVRDVVRSAGAESGDESHLEESGLFRPCYAERNDLPGAFPNEFYRNFRRHEYSSVYVDLSFLQSAVFWRGGA